MGVRKRLPATVLALGVVSFFTDLASEMIVPLLPVLFDRIGASMLQFGLLIGISEVVVAALKIVSGALSDRLRRRKPWIVFGYALSTVVRPLFAIVQAPWQAIAVRTGDRVGKGLRSAPRDALVADVVEPSERGRAFGWQRGMDHAGALVGALAAFVLLWGEVEVRTVFVLAVAPGVLAVLTAWVWVREAEPRGGDRTAVDPPQALRRLLPFLGVVGFAAVAAAIDLFALARAHELGVAPMYLPLLWVLVHTSRSWLSAPFGALSDRLGRRRVLAIGLFVHGLVLIGFAFVDAALWIWPLCLLLGLHAAFTEGAERGMVADLTGASRRGTAFGLYHGVQGVAAFAGAAAIGQVWDTSGAAAGFGVAAGAAFAALVLLAAVGLPAAGGRRSSRRPGSRTQGR